MTYNVISTGSVGNAVVINDIILIDCGVPFKALASVRKALKIVLLTHCHQDHLNPSTVKRLALERPTLRFACCEWLVQKLVACGVQKKNIDVLKIGAVHDYKLFQIVPIQLYHNVPNCGYRVFMGGEKAIYATDTGSMEGIEAKGYDLYLIEANYTDEEMAERIKSKQEQGIYAYEIEAVNNHLSKAKCDDFIYSNIRQNGKYVYLHQHK